MMSSVEERVETDAGWNNVGSEFEYETINVELLLGSLVPAKVY